MNKGGGATYNIEEIKKIKKVCEEHGLKLHLDGARLFNAIVANNQDPKQFGELFDTISICCSKGLGAPVGSLLLSSEHLNKKAKRVRKVFGGGMRQAGYLAAACIYAFDNHINRLADDHQRAADIANALQDKAYIKDVLPVETNIVIAELDSISSTEYLKKLESVNIHAVPFGGNSVRFVTHLDFNDDDLEIVVKAFDGLE